MLSVTLLDQAGIEVLPPDIVWNGYSGDLALDAAGGLQALAPLQTVVTLCLFTDARIEPQDLRFEMGGDRRGWGGNAFDVDRSAGEDELGSTLWLYRRHELNDATARSIESEAIRALQPLIRQGAVEGLVVKATAYPSDGRIDLAVTLTGRDGRTVFATQFDLIWR